MIWATGDTDASYDIENIILEYNMVTQPELTRMISNQYSARLAILYDRILRHRKISKDKSDTIWNINLNKPTRSMDAQLVLLFSIAWQFAHFSQCFRHYIRQAHRLVMAICCHARGTFGFTQSKMDCDELIDEQLSAQGADDRAPLACSCASTGTVAKPDVQGQNVCAQALRKHRERLAALVGGGQAKQYLGKAFTVDQIDALDDAEIVKLYVRSAPAFCGGGIHVFPNRKPASACCRPRGRSVCRACT